MGLTFHDWRPLEFFDSLANLQSGAEIYVYDPECNPNVFRVFFKGLIRDHRNGQIQGITYEVAPGEGVEVVANRYRKFGLALVPNYAPRNRVGYARTLDIDYMHETTGYDA